MGQSAPPARALIPTPQDRMGCPWFTKQELTLDKSQIMSFLGPDAVTYI